MQQMEYWKAGGIQLPLEGQSTANQETHFEAGLALQKEIFGDLIAVMYTNGRYKEWVFLRF